MWGWLLLAEAHSLWVAFRLAPGQAESCVLAPTPPWYGGGGGVSTVLAEPGLLWPQQNNVLLGDGSQSPQRVFPSEPLRAGHTGA